MNTNTNVLYQDFDVAKALGEKPSDLKQVPAALRKDANKALNGNDSVYIPKSNNVEHMKRLADFSANHRKNLTKKKKRNRMTKQSRKNNR